MYKGARIKKGLSTENAAAEIHIGRRSLINYEAGQCVPADVVMRMAEVYNDHTLTARHCTKACPIGQVYAYEVRDMDISTSILNIMNEFNSVKPELNRLVAIAADGVIDQEEVKDFEGILQTLFKLEHAIETIKLRAASVVSIENLIQQHNQKEKAPAYAAAR